MSRWLGGETRQDKITALLLYLLAIAGMVIVYLAILVVFSPTG